jgi:aspartyl-tRNA(Asn)/glutamyl-tRNA(Gln) amidotransferase subunit A
MMTRTDQFFPANTSTSTPAPLHLLSARDIASRVASGALRAVDLVAYLLTRIATLDSHLHAMVDIDAAGAMAQAAHADRLAMAGRHLPLLGVPFTVKDNLWVGGRPATCGSALFAGHIAPRDSWSVARLKANGAICIGITNCSEFACKGVTSNPLHGATLNPWGVNLTPGGSSGGAVAGVAAGFSPIALTTDSGGSTRRPAAHAGLLGFKCTSGLIPNPWGFDDPCRDLGSIGIVARGALDCAAMMDVLADYDARDPLSHPLPASMLSKNSTDARINYFTDAVIKSPHSNLRIAWSTDLGCDFAVDPDVAAAMQVAIQKLRAAGWQIDDASPQWRDDTKSYPFAMQQHAELAALYGKQWRTDPWLFDPVIGAQIESGLQLDAIELAGLPLRRHHARIALSDFFERYDLLLCPTVPVEAWSSDLLAPEMICGRPAGPRAHAVFTPLFNLCDVPALSVPCGFGARGLPVALQVVAPRYADIRVLQFGAEIERVIDTDFSAPMQRL